MSASRGSSSANILAFDGAKDRLVPEEWLPWEGKSQTLFSPLLDTARSAVPQIKSSSGKFSGKRGEISGNSAAFPC